MFNIYTLSVIGTMVAMSVLYVAVIFAKKKQQREITPITTPPTNNQVRKNKNASESHGAMINVEKELYDHINKKKSVTNLFWFFILLSTGFVVGVSGYVNWSTGMGRAGILGGLIAIALDVGLLSMGLRCWRKHNMVNKGIDWVAMLVLMVVGITCVGLFFGMQSNKASHDFTVKKNNTLLSTVTANQAGASFKERSENNAQIRAIAKSTTPPPAIDSEVFKSLSAFIGVDGFLFNIIMGVALVVTSVLLSTRLNSYFCPFTLGLLIDSIEKNNAAIFRAINKPVRTETITKKDEAHEIQEVHRTEEKGTPTERENKEAKYNMVKTWIEGMDDGDNITADEIRNKSRYTGKNLKELKEKLINNNVIEMVKKGTSWRYYKLGVADPEKKTPLGNVFELISK